MTFDKVLEALKGGKIVYRKHFQSFNNDNHSIKIYNPHGSKIIVAQHTFTALYHITNEDIFADDWEIEEGNL